MSAPGGWRPIADAPREENVLLASGHLVGEGSWGRNGWCWAIGRRCTPQPTLWQPLPLPPAPAGVRPAGLP